MHAKDDNEDEVRRALMTPVAEATPYQIELQARHHANASAYRTIGAFLDDSTLMQGIVPSGVAWREPGGPTRTETAHLLELVSLPDDQILVCFKGTTDVSVSRYGILNRGLITALSAEELCMSYPREVIREASRAIHAVGTELDVKRALLRLHDTAPDTE